MRCEICGTGEVFYRRPYEGVRLCKGCFKNSIVDKVRRTISEFRLLKADDHLAVAVSGGKDSLSLLHVLKRLCSKYPRSRLTAIAVDEGIERYREEALTLAKKFCEDSGIPLRALSFKDLYGFTLDELVEERGLKFPCSVCGVLRRRAIAVLAHQVGADKIATAHNLDDEVQTFLLNIFHGGHVQMRRTGPMLTGKGAFLKKVKPFCKLPEKEISLYAYACGIQFQSMTCPYAGAALRNDLRELIALIEERHHGSLFSAFNSIQRLKEVMSRSEEESDKICRICGWPSSNETCSVCRIIPWKPLSLTA